jgi:uncharacterized membrane protein
MIREHDSNYLSRYAAGFSIATALIHTGVAPEHLSEWWGYGLFFILAGVAQGLYGLLLLLRPWRYDERSNLRSGPEPRSVRKLYIGGILANAAIIFLYLITRTLGIPFFGPAAGAVEPWTPLGIVSKLIEIMIIICLIKLIKQSKFEEV